MNSRKREILKFYSILIILSLITITLLILPADFFDSGSSICLSVVLFDKQCYACGLTRAVQHFIHGEFATAYMYNKLVVIVLPLIIGLIGYELYKMYKKIYKS